MNRSAMARLQFIHDRIRGGHYPNATNLARELEVSRRTVQRDIEFMKDQLRAPIEYDSRRRGFYYTRPDFVLPSLPLTPREIAALHTAAHLLGLVAGSALEAPVRSLIDKLVAALPATVSLGCDTPDELSFGLPAIRGDEAQVVETLGLLQEAIVTHRTVDVLYYTAYRNDWRRRRLDPYHLHYRDGAWYAIAWCHWRQRILTFAVDRMHDVRLTSKAFQVRAGFDAREYLQTAWRIEAGDPVPVAVRFAPSVARYVRERRWHPTQEMQEEPDGSVILRVRVAGLPEVARWVLQFGGGAEVLEPEALRELVSREVLALVSTYMREQTTHIAGPARSPIETPTAGRASSR